MGEINDDRIVIFGRTSLLTLVAVTKLKSGMGCLLQVTFFITAVNASTIKVQG